MSYYTECCDATTITHTESIPLATYGESLQNEYFEVMGMCSECKEWSDCYSEDDLDYEDMEYANDMEDEE